jgi:hypothetical protein
MRYRSTTLAALAAGACLAAPAAAQADSIVFTRGGDVFLTTPDGSREHRVTTGGSYEDVTQADDGTIFAMDGGILHRLDQQGNAVAPPAGTSHLWDLDVSPDGSKIVAWYPTSDGGYLDAVGADGRSLNWQEQPGTNPQWIDNDLALTSNGAGWVMTFASGGPSTSYWFDTKTGEHMDRKYSPAITRARDRLAVVVREEPTFSDEGPPGPFKVLHYSNSSTPPRNALRDAPEDARPTLRCQETIGDVQPEHPRFSPDGSSIAWEYPDGIHVKPVYDLASCTQPAGGFTIAGARSPDWGPANVPAPKPDPEPVVPVGGPLQSARVAKPGRMKVALKKGVKVTITCSTACTTAGSLRFKGKVVAKGSKKLTGGKGALVLKFTAKGKKTLARSRKAKLALAVTATDEQGRSSQTTGSVALKR